ncbi:hypothetical protein A2454_05170 [Candidatus Peribacteria bacterium RIFOXYC2_FULL_55_14]|nr:MAG: hypothetical protein UY87_C0028G0007 [Candidatus Peribacteria bacterium GW2011_GWC2_54_8]OGJ71963.1 MAG: hypothetical protein A2198_03710 [Candidatus Peribacteria bacterium RIFOXYA1_FULL_56_14]OGJ73208.1 MAG: hypothetical protein A2217_03515 [Candidatus Peribacteria bacterium RIFOXYA2_FULL_55_28]OGJ75405.1 MAG: hypothetical protein A2384_00705 [Candidatus Peribacteria bacterium RIFOXYB1_FULL_54_35]OGJ76419.1 MAG: hypothetical protein A2327_01165 [Candidatus Peribacteria bacterium RIFOXY
MKEQLLAPITGSPVRVCTGTTRIAYVGPRRTLKVPRLDARGTLLRAERFREGWSANRIEAESWPEFRDIVLPTRAHIGALVSLQPTTEDLRMSVVDFTDIVERGLGSDVIEQADVAHTFDNPGNFGYDGEAVRLRDFGDPRLIAFLRSRREEVSCFLSALVQVEVLSRRLDLEGGPQEFPDGREE